MEDSQKGGIGGDRGGIVTARGTTDGLVIRLDGRVEPSNLEEALNSFVRSRRSFIEGNQVSLEWVGTKPEEDFVDKLSKGLADEFKISIKSSKLWSRRQDRSADMSDEISEDLPPSDIPDIERRIPKLVDKVESVSLFDGVDSIGFGSTRKDIEYAGSTVEQSVVGPDPLLWDDPDARILYTTLRSGQKVETEHSLVVFGDLNSGAEIVAGGDIIVLGTLRGVAHAGAYDETGGGRVIFSLNLQPTQLRIGMVISRGSSENRRVPEVARVDGGIIVVEPYHSRAWKGGKR